MAGTAFDFVKIEVPCPQCGKNDLQRVADLVASETTACGYCGAVIDLTSEDWRTRIAEQAEILKQIKPEPR